MSKPRHKVVCEWSANFAYAIGLIASDGNVSPDGRHVNFTSKDFELVSLFLGALRIRNRISKKARGGESEKKYFVVQFSDVHFCDFLLGVGITQRKSRTLTEVRVPIAYFFDFLRGCIDGDGSIGAYRHPESTLPQLRLRLYSASRPFLEWVVSQTRLNGIDGFILAGKRCFVLVYAKASSIRLLHLIYYPGFEYGLKRKYQRALPFLKES